MTSCIKCRKQHTSEAGCARPNPAPQQASGKHITVPRGAIEMDGYGKRLAYEFVSIKVDRKAGS